jgi:hypothetical protein
MEVEMDMKNMNLDELYDEVFLRPKYKVMNLQPWVLCPLCNSGVITGGHNAENSWKVSEVVVPIDERGTWAIPPIGSVPYILQEYRYFQCNNKNCFHAWGHHPTGKWYSGPLSVEKRKELGVHFNVLRKFDEKMKLFNQIYDFTDEPQVKGIETQKVILFTGAGLSMGLGYPSVQKCFKQLPQAFLENVIEWYDKAPSEKQKSIISDLEILFDELFYLQKMAFRYDLNEFFKRVERLYQQESDFYFNETLGLPFRSYYPPLYPIFVHRSVYKNMNTPHAKTVRNMIGDVTNMVMRNYAEPSDQSIALSDKIMPLLVNGLRDLNPNNSLAIFTTNYDLSMESWCKKQNSSLRYYDGTKQKRWVPSSNFDLTKDAVSLFYLHGCARWAIRLEEESGMGFDQEVEELANKTGKRKISGDNQHICYRGSSVVRIDDYDYIGMYTDPDQNLYPALLFPSTVKRRYVHSPPFNFAYEQLSQALLSAKILVLAGYSGRDETFKEMLYHAQEQNPDLQVVIIDITDIPPHLSMTLRKERRHIIKHEEGVCLESLKKTIKICKKLLKGKR